jgi:HNH endonuclease
MKKLPYNLNDIFDYSVVSGKLYWKIKPAQKINIGDLAGTVSRKDGYVQVQYKGIQYGAHRIAWALCFGNDPKELIDHINHSSSCNGIHNLREANHWENTAHRKDVSNTGYTNIKQNGKGFGVRLGHKWLGTYPTLEKAISVRDQNRQYPLLQR